MVEVKVGKKDSTSSEGPGCHCACQWNADYETFMTAQIFAPACACSCTPESQLAFFECARSE